MNRFKKTTLILSLFFALVINLGWVKSAEAVFGVADATVIVGDVPRILEKVVVGIAKVFLGQLKKRLLVMLQNDMVNWIQGGGKPRFVTNPKKLLEDAANQSAVAALDKFFSEKSGGKFDVCSPFKADLQILVSRQLLLPEERARCTLGDIKNNLNKFADNFNNGGWQSWIALHESQNTLPGSYLAATELIGGRVSAQQNSVTQEISAGKGFLDQKLCAVSQKITPAGEAKIDQAEYQRVLDETGDEAYARTMASSGTVTPYKSEFVDHKSAPGGGIAMSKLDANEKCTETVTATPGSILGDQISGALKGTGIDSLINAHDITEIINAVIDAAVNRVATEGLSLMRSGQGANPVLNELAVHGSYVNRGTVETGPATPGSQPASLGVAQGNANQLLNDSIDLKTTANRLDSLLKQTDLTALQKTDPAKFNQLSSASAKIQENIAFANKINNGVSLYVTLLIDYNEAGLQFNLEQKAQDYNDALGNSDTNAARAAKAVLINAQDDTRNAMVANQNRIVSSQSAGSSGGNLANLKITVIQRVIEIINTSPAPDDPAQLGLDISSALSQAMTVLDNPDLPGQKLLPKDINRIADELITRKTDLTNLEKIIREAQGTLPPVNAGTNPS